MLNSFKQNWASNLILQKLNELIFKKLNLIKNNDIDVTATLKFLDKQVKDPNWKPIIQKNFVACNKNMAPNVDSYQKQFNITKAQCNLKYASVVLCMDVLGLQVRSMITFHVHFLKKFFSGLSGQLVYIW